MMCNRRRRVRVEEASISKSGFRREAVQRRGESVAMKFLLVLSAWCALFVLCWPVALLMLVLAPLIWLVLLPFRLVGIAVEGVFALIRAVFFLPARILGYKG